MKHIFIIPIILIFISCSGKNPVEKSNNFKNSNFTLNIDSTLPFSKKLTNLLHEYDTSVVLEASYFICKIFKIEYAQKEKIDYCNLYKDLFLKKRHFYLIKLDSIILKNDFFFISIRNWCENQKLLGVIINSNLNSDRNIYFEEVLNNIPATKKILNTYLPSKGQYWGSLDVTQSCKLFFDILIYLDQLNTKERTVFFKEYYKTTFELLSN